MGQKIQRENRAQLKLTDTIFLFGICPSSNFLKKLIASEAGSVSIFRQRAPNLVDPLDVGIHHQWASQKP
jgi:hypothetical protein